MLSAAPGAYDNYAVPTISFLEAWQEPGISLVPTGVLAKISNCYLFPYAISGRKNPPVTLIRS